MKNTLYTRSDLATLLDGSGVDVDTFVGRLKPRKVFRRLFLGRDLLNALDTAPALREESTDSPASPNAPRKTSGNRPLRRTTKNLIGGHFTPESLGIIDH